MKPLHFNKILLHPKRIKSIAILKWLVSLHEKLSIILCCSYITEKFPTLLVEREIIANA